MKHNQHLFTSLPNQFRSTPVVCTASTSYIIRDGGIRNTCYANYRVAVGLLVGQGWER